MRKFKFNLVDLGLDDFVEIKTADEDAKFKIYQCNEFGKEEICLALHRFTIELYIDRKDLERCMNGEEIEIGRTLENATEEEFDKRYEKSKAIMKYEDGMIVIETEEE